MMRVAILASINILQAPLKVQFFFLRTPRSRVLESACGRHVIDEYGDHVHSCKKHSGSTKSAHETVLDAVEALCHQAGLSTERRNIPTIVKQNGKTGLADRNRGALGEARLSDELQKAACGPPYPFFRGVSLAFD